MEALINFKNKKLEGALITDLRFEYEPRSIGRRDSVTLCGGFGVIYHVFNERNITAILNKPSVFGDKMQVLALKAYDFLISSRERYKRVN